MKKTESAHEGEIREIWKILNQVSKDLGGYTDTASRCLEDEFHDALSEAGEIGGARLEGVYPARMQKSRKGRVLGEYDLVCINGGAVFVGEVKHKLTEDKVRKFKSRDLPKFAKVFPEIAGGRRVVGMVGGARIDAAAAEAARELGLYVLRLKNNRKLQVVAPD